MRPTERGMAEVPSERHRRMKLDHTPSRTDDLKMHGFGLAEPNLELPISLRRSAAYLPEIARVGAWGASVSSLHDIETTRDGANGACFPLRMSASL